MFSSPKSRLRFVYAASVHLVAAPIGEIVIFSVLVPVSHESLVYGGTSRGWDAIEEYHSVFVWKIGSVDAMGSWLSRCCGLFDALSNVILIWG